MKLEILNYDIRSLLNNYNELQSVAKTLGTLLSTKYKDLVHQKYPNADVEKVVWNETRPYKEKYKALLDLVNNGLTGLRDGEKLPTLNELITLIRTTNDQHPTNPNRGAFSRADSIKKN